MLNPDGYTPLFNPTEYPQTFPAALGYIPGKYATGGDLSATLNPYVAYRRDAPRCMFEAGGSEARTIRLYAPSGPIHFGYAVDACWEPVENVIDPLTDFPPEANCLEAYRLDVTIGSGLSHEPGDSAPIQVEVYDHQGLETISTATVEAPDLFAGELALAFSGTSPNGAFVFSGMLSNDLGAPVGEYPLLVKVTDTGSDPHFGEIAAWQVSCVTVGPPKGWARTWGGTGEDDGYDVAVDGSGNVYVTGWFIGTVDFDPGSGVDNHTSNGPWDVFLSKFDSSGAFKWARTWGGSNDDDVGTDVAVDGSGNVYVTGWFRGTVDFDPGSGVDNRTSNGYDDVFLSKFDSLGDFKWARTWGGGSNYDWGLGVAVDGSGNVYVTGRFSGKADFDPGSGVDNHTSHGHTDVFLSKLDSSGDFNWARTWGGSDDECGNGVAVHGSGNVYVTGWFIGTVDFDPGSGVDSHTSNGYTDVFLSKLDSSGAFAWARTWGGSGGADQGQGVAVDGSGNVYVTGYFLGTVDFDPGSGVDNHTSNGNYDVFLSKFDSSGAFKGARTWGAITRDEGGGVAVDGSGNVCVTGGFQDTVDFDPGSGVDNHTSNGECDVFLSKFDPLGDFKWARTWGGSAWDAGGGVAVDGSGNVYVTGCFRDTVDFDPGSSVDNHTSNGDPDVFLSKFPPDGNW